MLLLLGPCGRSEAETVAVGEVKSLRPRWPRSLSAAFILRLVLAFFSKCKYFVEIYLSDCTLVA